MVNQLKERISTLTPGLLVILLQDKPVVKILFIYLTPLIPLSMIWIYIPIMRGKDFKKRGKAPLRLPPINDLLHRSLTRP